MKMLKLFGKSVVSMAVIAACYSANAADNSRVGKMSGGMPLRMPTMPTVGLTTIGNPAVTTIGQPAEANYTHTYAVSDNDGNGGSSGNDNNGNGGDNGNTPVTECPDGGVRNSEYTVAMCMDDVLNCVNTGALQGGLNDLFNEDVRNSIMGGMQLCQSQVDKCIHDVRLDCRNVYAAFTDVWLDFNSRVIQPEYYNFVLRRTGLTPNQAENTCLLLDRNTYGSSFAAVSDANAVNTEYNNKVGAYNRQEKASLSKDNPQGETINSVGYDGNRGHYARWDASKAECLIRVAAYNKDKLITNSWLFGAIGDDNPAEVWEKAGSSFTCNKELFDFKSLLNDTKTAAVIAVPGGAVLGTAIGAAAGAGAYNKKKQAADDAAGEVENSLYGDPCDNETYRKKLGAQVAKTYNNQVLETYLYDNFNVSGEGDNVQTSGTKMFENVDYYKLTKEQCQTIHNLRSKINLYKSAIDYCEQHLSQVINNVTVKKYTARQSVQVVKNGSRASCVSGITCNGDLEYEKVEEYINKCLFVPLQIGLALDRSDNADLPYCNHNGRCVTTNEVRNEINQFSKFWDEITPVVDKKVLAKTEKELSKGKEIGKGIAIGATTGAAVGGLATAITAFVEKNNITCKVGDGLNSVALGKSFSIDSLKDFYVKWNLKLPDTVSPTSVVTSRASWEQACSQFNNKLMDCPNVQINLKVDNTYELVSGACKLSGSVCLMNYSTALSHGIE